MMAADSPQQRRAAQWRADAAEVAWAADIMRVVARHDGYMDARRGDVSLCQASLLEAVGRHLPAMPVEIVTEALAVVDAVNRATNHRR